MSLYHRCLWGKAISLEIGTSVDLAYGRAPLNLNGSCNCHVDPITPSL